MTLLQVASLGQPILRQIALPIAKKTIESASFQCFLDDLVESMIFHDGVGLAAPQVFRSQRVVAVYVPSDMDEQKEGIEPSVFVNPQITPIDQEIEENWEGCLSLADLRGRVCRSKSISLSALDRQGRSLKLELTGFSARVLQHEVDHLDGRLFVDRMKDLSSLTFAKELERQWECPDHEA